MSNTTPLLSDLMTDDEAAAELHRHTRTLKRWRDLRQGPPYIRFGREIRYRREAVRNWLLSQEQAA